MVEQHMKTLWKQANIQTKIRFVYLLQYVNEPMRIEYL